MTPKYPILIFSNWNATFLIAWSATTGLLRLRVLVHISDRIQTKRCIAAKIQSNRWKTNFEPMNTYDLFTFELHAPALHFALNFILWISIIWRVLYKLSLFLFVLRFFYAYYPVIRSVHNNETYVDTDVDSNVSFRGL